MLDVRIFHNAKIVALANRAKLGWFWLLCEAKQQDTEGVFGSRAGLMQAAGPFKDCVAAWLDVGLIHYAESICPKCSKQYGDVPETSAVVHDWHEYQVSRTTSWRLEKAVSETPDETTVKQPRNNGATPFETSVKPLARVTRASVSLSSSPSSTEGVQGEEADVFAFLARHGAAIRPESGFGIRLLALMDRRTAVLVLRTAQSMGGPYSDRQWVFGLEKALEDVPDLGAANVAEADAKRAARRDEGIWKRRIDAYRHGGSWDEAWGEPPA